MFCIGRVVLVPAVNLLFIYFAFICESLLKKSAATVTEMQTVPIRRSASIQFNPIKTLEGNKVVFRQR